jgi:ATP-binding cassette subfamily C protein CydD
MYLDRRVFAQARDSRKDLAGTVGSGVLSGLLVVLQSYALSVVIAGVFLDGLSLVEVRPFLFAFLLLSLARSFFVWVSEVAAQRVASRVKVSLRAALTEKLLTLGPQYTRGERTGELTSTVTEGVEALDAYLAQYLPRLALGALVPLLVLVFVLPADPISGVILLITAPLIPLFMFLIGGAAKERSKRQWLSLSRMSAQFLDTLQGLTALKRLGQSRAQEVRVRETSEQFHDATMGVLRVAFLSALVLEMTATISTALVAVGVGLRLLYGHIDFQDALFVLILAPEFYRPLRSLGGAFHAGLPGVEAAKRIFTVLETPTPMPAISQVQTPSAPRAQDIEIDRVTFSHDTERGPALDRISFEIPAGRKVALVGPVGAGKTTVAHLLLRFADPQGGTIRVGGVSLTEMDPSWWRQQVAWVPQHPHLLHGSVVDNISLGKSDATLDEIMKAAQFANAHEFIDELPRGYETSLGEGGERLSGGQAQRIALARAFVKDAPLLILDEPTSQLDPVAEALVQEGIGRLVQGRTVLLMAHRLATVLDADKIVLLSAGRVIEEGTHGELLKYGRFFPRLVAAHEGAS